MTDLIVTGITGFLGRHVVDEALNRNIYNRIYGISRRWVDQELLSTKWGNRVTMINGDIRDYDSLRDLFLLIQESNPLSDPDVIHCAAYKHISMAQNNTREAVDVNILGTRNLIDNCRIYGTRNLIFISTDKAASPVNVYGESKAIAEQMVLNAGGVVLRFGNIWNSTGSLIGKWHRAMQSDNPILEITDPTMTRYFYPISEAVDYILMATDYSNCVIVPNLQSISLVNLAAAFMFAYDKQADIEIIGIRPGEKLHEQMTSLEELSRMKVEIIHGKYLKFTPGQLGALPPGFEGMLSSKNAEKFEHKKLIELINSTKEG